MSERSEKVLWAMFLLPTLVPDVTAGISPSELLSIICHFSASGLLAWQYAQKGHTPRAIWLLVAYLVLSFAGLSHDPINYFIPYLAGGLAFTCAVAVGGCLPRQLQEELPRWLFLFFFLATCLDLAFDYTGWLAHQGAAEWTEGVRGSRTSQSPNGMFLATFASALIAFPTLRRWRVAGAVGIPLAFYHVVIVGQGRGAAALAGGGMAMVIFRDLRALPALVLALVPLVILFFTSGSQEASQPFMSRAASQDLSSIDRLEHAQLGQRLLLNMSPEELLTGIWNKKVLIANGGIGMHNAFFDIVTRFGLPAATPWVAFSLFALIAALSSMVARAQDQMQVVAGTIVIQVTIASFAGPLFVNWRACVIPGLCAGLMLQKLRQGSSR